MITKGRIKTDLISMISDEVYRKLVGDEAANKCRNIILMHASENAEPYVREAVDGIIHRAGEMFAEYILREN